MVELTKSHIIEIDKSNYYDSCDIEDILNDLITRYGIETVQKFFSENKFDYLGKVCTKTYFEEYTKNLEYDTILEKLHKTFNNAFKGYEDYVKCYPPMPFDVNKAKSLINLLSSITTKQLNQKDVSNV